MKTAIQELIENAKTAKDNDNLKDYISYDELIDVLTEFLPTEREQIINAAYSGKFMQGRE